MLYLINKTKLVLFIIMFKLSKKTEYAIVALQYIMGHADKNVVTVREIAEHHNISQTLLAKLLQILARERIIESVQGSQGGYTLVQNAKKISLAKIMEAIEGPIHITDCYVDVSCCERTDSCTLRKRLAPVQKGLVQHLQNITLADFVKE